VTTILGKVKMIKGLGNAAVWSQQLGQLWVLKGTTMFDLSEYPPRSDSVKLLTRAAKRVLVHIK
jgi:hypothetical protein